jgi:hypothetical protein
MQEAPDSRSPSRFQKHLGTKNIGVHERNRTQNGSVDVRLGSEMHNHVMTWHHLFDHRSIDDVTLHESQPGVRGNRRKVRSIA